MEDPQMNETVKNRCELLMYNWNQAKSAFSFENGMTTMTCANIFTSKDKRSDIDSLKTNMFKIQISLKNDFSEKDFQNFNVLSFKKNGSVATVIMKGERSGYEKILTEMNPVILDFLPLTLEEIFIYEMEVLGYEFEQII